MKEDLQVGDKNGHFIYNNINGETVESCYPNYIGRDFVTNWDKDV